MPEDLASQNKIPLFFMIQLFESVYLRDGSVHLRTLLIENSEALSWSTSRTSTLKP
jgi:hypothetical protein